MKKQTIKNKKYNTKKKSKRNGLTKKNKTRHHNNKSKKKLHGEIYGGYGEFQTEVQRRRESKIKNDFRKMFLENFQLIKRTLKNERQLNTNVSNLIQNMMVLKKKDGTLYTINGLIPVTNNYIPIDKDTYTKIKNPLVDFVPLLCILIYNIRNNNEVVKRLIDSFVENDGDINLHSSKYNITALSTAIEIKNRDIFNYLLRKGSIPEEGQEIMQEPVKKLTPEQIREPTREPTPEQIRKPTPEQILQPIREPTPEQILQPTREPTPEQILQPIKEPIREQILQPIREPTREPMLEPIREPVKESPAISIPKLSIPDTTSLPQEIRYKQAMEYDRSIEPPFWIPIFGEGELFRLREVLTEIMIKDSAIPYKYELKNVATPWRLCSLIKSLFPAFYIPKENKPYEAFKHEEQKMELVNMHPSDYKIYNTILCASMLCFGVISKKMESQDYTLIFKGGKANQLVLSAMKTTLEYESDDIDILVIPNTGVEYNREHIGNLSSHIGFLLKWLLTSPEEVNLISVLLPDPTKSYLNPNIVKISYIKQYDSSRYIFRPISDVDFKELSDDVQPFFAEPNTFDRFVPELDTHIRFICPNITGIIDEKLYYYIKYIDFKEKLESGQPISEPGLTIQECNRLSQKLKRSIKAISYALQEQNTTNPSELLEGQKIFLTDLLRSKIDIINHDKNHDSKIDTIVRELIK